MLKEIYREYLVNSGFQEKNILIMELDDDRNSKYRDPIELGEYVREYCKGDGEYYVFIDEIQKVYKILNPVLTEGKRVLAGDDDEETISFVDVVLGLELLILLKKTKIENLSERRMRWISMPQRE